MSHDSSSHTSPSVFGHGNCSRRHFLRAGGAAAVGLAAFGSSTAAADASGRRRGRNRNGLPNAVGGFSPLLLSGTGLEIPFFLPPEVDPFTGFPAGPPRNPSTIADFNGQVAMVEANGITENTNDGVARRWASDIRTMEGTFRDRDGRVGVGAFAFL